MSLDKLAVIFIIIILPISIVLNMYTDAQTETLKIQMQYDNVLDTATSDAIKAYQLNAFNETTSNISAEKMREINAASNAFFTSLATGLNMQGYSKEDIQDFVPALVFTMYDGYYMYSKYINTLTDSDYVSEEAESPSIKPSTFQNGELLYGVKPFVTYSCRYQDYPNSGDDFVISYTLDNYITIQGIVNGKFVNDSGYLISNLEKNEDETFTYNGVTISKNETILEEYVGTELYKYHKMQGIKWYYDENYKDKDGNDNPQWFYLLNGRKIYDFSKSGELDKKEDDSAYNYYKSAFDFTQRVMGNDENQYNLSGLKVLHAVEKDDLNQTNKEEEIFALEGIEEPDSNFNRHRLAVIRYTIEKNLSIAIKNYNHYTQNVEADFEMPELKETEWDKIMNNMTLISFLQGIPIGTKIYNGCSVVANNSNDEIVTEESIYIANTDNTEYYKSTYRDFKATDNLLGVSGVDLQRRSIEDDESVNLTYYYPKLYYANYDSITNPSRNANIYSDSTDEDLNFEYYGNIYRYFREQANNNATMQKVAQAYFTALGRERYSTFKIYN
ncbi:MAG: hypothetical protein IKF97_00995 [Clostridia bacterium]|nr:hypothetical protein [Clostridia bacterium]